MSIEIKPCVYCKKELKIKSNPFNDKTIAEKFSIRCQTKECRFRGLVLMEDTREKAVARWNRYADLISIIDNDNFFLLNNKLFALVIMCDGINFDTVTWGNNYENALKAESLELIFNATLTKSHIKEIFASNR